MHGLEDDQFGTMLKALNHVGARRVDLRDAYGDGPVTTTNVATWTAAEPCLYISLPILGPILPITPGGPLSPSSQDLLPKYFHPFTAGDRRDGERRAAGPASP